MSANFPIKSAIVSACLVAIGCRSASAGGKGAVVPAKTQPEVTEVAGWQVTGAFGSVTREAYESGAVVIVPLRVQRNANAKSSHRSEHTYQVDPPDAEQSPAARYAWGDSAIDNGHGTYHWYHERLAFDLSTKKVFVLPRRGMRNVDAKQAGGPQFWCDTNALDEEAMSMDHYGAKVLDVCPTAFIKEDGERKGIAILGTPKALYSIDTAFIAKLVGELSLLQEVEGIRADVEAAKVRKVALDEARQQAWREDIERRRTAGERGQNAIASAEIGARLCADANLRDMSLVVNGFLENVAQEKVQVRVNNILSSDGRTRFDGHVNIDGIDFTPNQLVWTDRRVWRACE